tara:strand:+ start:962 stop:1510 length:549 start_codon:yes stop_codon:yes gene_type:complete
MGTYVVTDGASIVALIWMFLFIVLAVIDHNSDWKTFLKLKAMLKKYTESDPDKVTLKKVFEKLESLASDLTDVKTKVNTLWSAHTGTTESAETTETVEPEVVEEEDPDQIFPGMTDVQYGVWCEAQKLHWGEDLDENKCFVAAGHGGQCGNRKTQGEYFCNMHENTHQRLRTPPTEAEEGSE